MWVNHLPEELLVSVMVWGNVYSYSFPGCWAGTNGWGRESQLHIVTVHADQKAFRTSEPSMVWFSFRHKGAAHQSPLGMVGGCGTRNHPWVCSASCWAMEKSGGIEPDLFSLPVFSSPSCFSFLYKDWMGMATEKLRMKCWQGALLEIKFCPILCTILVSHICE